MTIHPSTAPAPAGRHVTDPVPDPAVDTRPLPSGAVPITLISRSWVTVGTDTTDRIAA